jgi:hypothetical protein
MLQHLRSLTVSFSDGLRKTSAVHYFGPGHVLYSLAYTAHTRLSVISLVRTYTRTTKIPSSLLLFDTHGFAIFCGVGRLLVYSVALLLMSGHVRGFTSL